MKIFRSIIGVIGLLCVFYGIPLSIVNMGKEGFFIYLIVGLVGLALIGLVAVLMMLEKRNQKGR